MWTLCSSPMPVALFLSQYSDKLLQSQHISRYIGILDDFWSTPQFRKPPSLPLAPKVIIDVPDLFWDWSGRWTFFPKGYPKGSENHPSADFAGKEMPILPSIFGNRNEPIQGFSHEAFPHFLLFCRRHRPKMIPTSMGLSENVGLIFPMIASHLKTG